MATFPLNLSDLLGHWESYIVFLLIGVAFGAVLEMSGFGNSTKLAKQFYFKDMTVLKVMFSAIVVAMVLVFLAVSAGILDYDLVWVNPTFLWPGIIGGLVMGFGFIIGGFCPGTSLVAAATFKLDGVFFVVGVLFGVFAFGETVSRMEDFWYSSDMGRYTLQDWLNVEAGYVVLGVVVMALFAFFVAERVERVFGDFEAKDKEKYPVWRYGAAGSLMLGAVVVIAIGMPTTEPIKQTSDEQDARLAERTVQIHAGELLDLRANEEVKLTLIDVRSEDDFNQFHPVGSTNIPLESLDAHLEGFLEEPAEVLFIMTSNDETAATEAWRMMVSAGVPNVYILAHGINGWIETFAAPDFRATHVILNQDEDALDYAFAEPLGESPDFANPNADDFELNYTPLVEVETKPAATGGGCG